MSFTHQLADSLHHKQVCLVSGLCITACEFCCAKGCRAKHTCNILNADGGVAYQQQDKERERETERKRERERERERERDRESILY